MGSKRENCGRWRKGKSVSNISVDLAWSRLCGIADPRTVLRGLALLDELRIVISESAPEACCQRQPGLRAIDGRLRCTECGRPQ